MTVIIGKDIYLGDNNSHLPNPLKSFDAVSLMHGSSTFGQKYLGPKCSFTRTDYDIKVSAVKPARSAAKAHLYLKGF
jgi:uncharacterized ferredoxin-like protein